MGGAFIWDILMVFYVIISSLKGINVNSPPQADWSATVLLSLFSRFQKRKFYFRIIFFHSEKLMPHNAQDVFSALSHRSFLPFLFFDTPASQV